MLTLRWDGAETAPVDEVEVVTALIRSKDEHLNSTLAR